MLKNGRKKGEIYRAYPSNERRGFCIFSQLLAAGNRTFRFGDGTYPKYKRSFKLGEHNLNGDARSLYITLQKDYEEVMQRIANNINENAHCQRTPH